MHTHSLIYLIPLSHVPSMFFEPLICALLHYIHAFVATSLFKMCTVKKNKTVEECQHFEVMDEKKKRNMETFWYICYQTYRDGLVN